MDDLKRFRDFQRWECQRAEESYVKGVEEENKALQQATKTLPDIMDKRVEEVTVWMDSRLREFRNAYDSKFECALSRQRVENVTVHDQLKALEARLEEAIDKNTDCIESSIVREKEERKNDCELLKNELREYVGESLRAAATEVEGKLNSMSASINAGADLLKAQEGRAKKNMLKIETDLSLSIAQAEKTARQQLADVEEKVDEAARRIKSEAMRLQESINDVGERLAALGAECQRDIAKESQESAAALEALCDRLLIESDKRAEDGLRIAMQLSEVKDMGAQKDEVWARDWRMMQETLHFKLQKCDDDLTAAVEELQKSLVALEAKSEGAAVNAATSAREAFSSQLDDTCAQLDVKIAAIAENAEQAAAKINERLFTLTAQQVDTVQKCDKLVDPLRLSVEKCAGAISTIEKQLEAKAAGDEVRVLSERLQSIQRLKEGNISFTWVLTKQELEKHEVRSPHFALREMENLHLRLHPKGRLTSKPNFSAVALVRKRETTNPFECEEAPLRVTFTCGSVISKPKELDAWDDEFDAAIAENFIPTVDLCCEITVTVV